MFFILSDHNKALPYAGSPAIATGQGLVLKGCYTLKQTNDWLITRAVFADMVVPVSINSGCILEAQPNVVVHCKSIVVFFFKARSMEPHCT